MSIKARSNLSIGSEIIQALVPLDGWIMALIEVYADESGDDHGLKPLCVAGYLFERDKAVQATEKWVAVLKDKKWPKELPFFRTSSCAHGNGHFSGFSLEERVCVQKRMIEIVKKYSLVALAAMANEKDYEEVVPSSKNWPNAYAFLARNLIFQANKWADKHSYSGKIMYVYEAGHRHQKNTNQILNEIALDEGMSRHTRYGGHAFVKKEDCPMVQSGDLIAWHTLTDFKHIKRAEGPRKDYQALLGPEDMVQRWNKEQLKEAAPLMQKYDYAR